MATTSPSPPVPRLSPQRTLRLAWAVLLAAFTAFCAILLAAGYGIWQYRTYATIEPQGTVLIERSAGEAYSAEWVTWRPPNRSVFQEARSQEAFGEGAQVRVAGTAGYGQVATIRLFDQSTLDMWAGADLLLEKLQVSRWNRRTQTVAIRQSGGYVRYDLRRDQPYERVSYIVAVGNAYVDLGLGGSYSIEILPPERQIHILAAATPTVFPFVVDVAVRTGTADVHGADGRVVRLPAGQRILIDPTGAPQLSIPARWELVRDGTFTEHSEEEYNNTTRSDQPALPRSRTWQVYSGGAGNAGNGFFRLSSICRPPDTSGSCAAVERRHAAWFYRTGGQTQGFVTGVRQFFGPTRSGADISEYRSLVLSFWARVLNQSVEQAGNQGTECPVMVRLLAKQNSPVDPEHERVICVFTSTDPSAEPVRYPNLVYYRVEPYAWTRLEIELRDPAWLPDYRYLRGIEIYANGHDYDSRVTDISLIGTQ